MRTLSKAISATVAGLSAVALLAACSSGDDEAGGDGGGENKPAEARPIISEAKARSVLDNYVETNNRANENVSPQALSEVEGGALFEQSSAQYKHFPTYDKKDQEIYKKPFRYLTSEAEFFIPSSGDWYMVHAPVKGAGFEKGEHGLLVFERAGGGTWKLVASVGVEEKLPEPAQGKDGFPVVLEEDARVGEVALDKLDDAVSDLYVSGGKEDGALLADSAVRKNMVEDYRTRKDWIKPEHEDVFETEFETENKKWDDAYKPEFPDVYALRTADGGALSVFNSYNSRVDFATEVGFHIIPGDVSRLYVKEKEPLGVREYYSVQNLVHLPAEGKAEQLGGEVQMIGAS